MKCAAGVSKHRSCLLLRKKNCEDMHWFERGKKKGYDIFVQLDYLDRLQILFMVGNKAKG